MLTTVTSRSGRCVTSGNKLTAITKAAARQTHSATIRPNKRFTLLRKNPVATAGVGTRKLLFRNVRRAASMAVDVPAWPGTGLVALRQTQKGLRRAMTTYDKLLKKHLFLTCTLTAMILNTLGSSIHQKRSGIFNIEEIYRMCSWAGLVTPIVLTYHGICEGLLARAGVVGAARVPALALCGCLWNFVSGFAFFTFMALLEGRRTKKEVTERVWGSNYWDGSAHQLHKMSIPVWGTIDLVTFSMIPLQYRTLWYNVLGIFYSMALCNLNAQTKN